MARSEVAEVDVLVIGGGIAGLFAAIKAKELNPDLAVLLVDKATPGSSGCSAFAAGVFAYVDPGDDHVEDYFREIVVDNSEWLIDQDYVRFCFEDSYRRFLDLVHYGVEVELDKKGQYKRLRTLTSNYGFCTPFAGGLHLMWKLRSRALKVGVRFLERVAVQDLLVEGNRCVGAVGYSITDGTLYTLLARGTVLAAGTYYSNREPMGASGATGDGPALGLRAGLEMRNAEQLGQATAGIKGAVVAGLHIWFGSGAILVNARGERFMERYNPVLREGARRFETARAILNEWKEGRGPCYLDCTHLSEETIRSIENALPLETARLRSRGMDFRRDKIEFVPAPIGLLHCGGLRIDEASGRVNRESLWAVGTAADYCGGVDSTVVAMLTGSAIQGAAAGTAAAQSCAHTPAPGRQVANSHPIGRAQDVRELLRDKGVDPEKMITKILTAIFEDINLLKNAPGLRRAETRLADLKAELPGLRARDPFDLSRGLACLNMVQVAQAAAKASLVREESRRAHYRIDFPTRNDESWIKWIMCRLDQREEIQISVMDVPFKDHWTLKPARKGA